METCLRTDHLWDMCIPVHESDSIQCRYSQAQQPDLNLHVWSPCGVTCNQAQLLGKSDPKSSQPPGVQVLTSELVWSSRWKEERIIWTLLAHRRPKALLYHSGDLPLQDKQQTMHLFHLQWGPEPPVWERYISAHTWGPLWRCVWAWSWQSHRAPGGTATPAPPLSLPQFVGCLHARQTRTRARRSLYTGLCAMTCSRARSKPPHNKHNFVYSYLYLLFILFRLKKLIINYV